MSVLLELAVTVTGLVVGGLLCLLFYGIGHDHGAAEVRAYEAARVNWPSDERVVLSELADE